MPNIKSTINAHNNKILRANQGTTTDRCNCRDKGEYPLRGECRTKSIVYQARVTANGNTESYRDLTAGEFKTRYSNHKTSFNNASKRNTTELSKHIWSLKNNGANFNIKWSVWKHANAYSIGSEKCQLKKKKK